MIKIWERYLLLDCLKGTLSFLAVFYGLYVLLDFASHTTSFYHFRAHWLEIVVYYLCDLIKQLDILLPLSLLVASIRTLCRLNVHHELVALLCSGLSKRALLRPLLVVALASTLFLYVNSQFLFPTAITKLKKIEMDRANKKKKKLRLEVAQKVNLPNGTMLLYHHYDAESKTFFDTYWVRSIDDLFRIESLSFGSTPIGKFVDHIIRNKEGELFVSESDQERSFPELSVNQERLFEAVATPEDLSLSQLFNKLPNEEDIKSEKEAQISSVFYYKLVIPWFCLLAVIGPAPFCLTITRALPQFFIYAGSLFSLIFCSILMESLMLLGKKQVAAPFFLVLIPFLAIFTLLSWNFRKKITG